jgi:hypothetical protein
MFGRRYATDTRRRRSPRELARRLGVSRGTVDRALEADCPPKYERKPAGSSFDAYAQRVRALLVQTPTMPASVLAERVGWTGAASLFRDKVRAIRPEYLPADPVDRLVHEPGKAMQCDLWFPHEPLPLGHGQESKPPVRRWRLRARSAAASGCHGTTTGGSSRMTILWIRAPSDGSWALSRTWKRSP